MRIIQKGILGLKGASYYIHHLSIINPFLPVEITPKEREVLGHFMNFKGELADVNRFNSEYRKIVRDTLKISHGGLSNHLTSLIKKGAIKEELTGVITISEILLPEEKQQFYQFKITQE